MIVMSEWVITGRLLVCFSCSRGWVGFGSTEEQQRKKKMMMMMKMKQEKDDIICIYREKRLDDKREKPRG